MKRRGIITFDAVAGLIVMIALLVVLGTTTGQRSRAMSRLADTRNASRLAEKTLTDLQHGRVEVAEGVNVTHLGPLDTDPQSQWTRVEVTVNGRTVSLVGTTRRQP